MPVPFLDVRAMVAEVREQADEAWRDLLDEGDFVRGAAVTRFEQQWATYCGVKHAIGVANGTDALWLTLRALGVREDDEVIVADTVADAITPRTRAVIVVHLFGQLPDMDAIIDLAHRTGVAVVEDAAQAHGARWRGARAGSFGIAGCFSFYPGKNLGAFGDGGAIVTSDDALAQTIRTLSDHGRMPASRHDHGLVGFNSRLDTLQAAVLSAKLPHLDDWNRRRRAFVGQYRELLEGAHGARDRGR
jgi:dTDP-4-amino-4,6-dideoxygalactose transaminase